MRAAVEMALTEVRRRVRSTTTAGGTSEDPVGGAQGKGAPVDLNCGNANQWADKVKSRVQFGYDADL
jgi:hypothetical protein